MNIRVSDLVFHAKLGTSFRVVNNDDERDYVELRKSPVGGWVNDLGRFGPYIVRMLEAIQTDYLLIYCEQPE